MRRLLARALRRCAQWMDALTRWLLELSVGLDPSSGVLGGLAVPPAHRLPWQPAPAPPHWERLIRQHAPQLLARHQAARAGDASAASPTPGACSTNSAAEAAARLEPSPAGRWRAPVPPSGTTRRAWSRHSAAAWPRSAPFSSARSAPAGPPRPGPHRPGPSPALGAPPPRPITPEPRTAPPRVPRVALEPRALESRAPGPDVRPERHDPRRVEPDHDPAGLDARLVEPDRRPARLGAGVGGPNLATPDHGWTTPDRSRADDGLLREQHRWPALPDQWVPAVGPTSDPQPGRPSVASRYPSLPDDSTLWAEPVGVSAQPDPDTAEHLGTLADEQRGRSWNG